MFRQLIFFIFFLCVPFTLFGEIYKWVDSQGVVHFSDKPQQGASEVELPNSDVDENNSEEEQMDNTQGEDEPVADEENDNQETIEEQNSEASADDEQSTTQTSEEENKVPTKYNVSIESPANQETITPGMRANFSVKIAVEPELAEGHEVELFLDGESVGTGAKLEFTLSDLDRGEHTLQARVYDKRTKKELGRSGNITIYIKQVSVAFNKPKVVPTVTLTRPELKVASPVLNITSPPSSQ